VRVTGEVQYPGTYTIRARDERLTTLIERAGGITPWGDAGAAYFSRLLPTAQSVERLVRRAVSIRDSTTGSLRSTPADVARLDEGGGRIRVGVDVPRALVRRTSAENLFLVGGDSLHIPARQQIVAVRGEVNAPTALVANGGGLGRYVAAAGGVTSQGNAGRAYVIQPSGKIQSRTRLLWVIRLDPTPQPGATVVVPAKGERTSGSLLQTLALVTQTLATITAAIAISR
jgi:protein involved in polysaccharide export with SLBB domain